MACIISAHYAPQLIIDEHGVFDSQLGVGKISWSDIEDVHIETAYGNRFLCFRLRSSEQYLARLQGKQREKMLFHRQLGFQRFNVDVGQLPISLLDLKKQIELRIPKQG